MLTVIEYLIAIVQLMLTGDYVPNMFGSGVYEDAAIVDQILTIRESLGY